MKEKKELPPRLKPEEISFTDHALHQIQMRFSFNGRLEELIKLLEEKILPNIIPLKKGKHGNSYRFRWRNETYIFIIEGHKVKTLLYRGWKKILSAPKKKRRR